MTLLRAESADAARESRAAVASVAEFAGVADLIPIEVINDVARIRWTHRRDERRRG